MLASRQTFYFRPESINWVGNDLIRWRSGSRGITNEHLSILRAWNSNGLFNNNNNNMLVCMCVWLFAKQNREQNQHRTVCDKACVNYIEQWWGQIWFGVFVLHKHCICADFHCAIVAASHMVSATVLCCLRHTHTHRHSDIDDNWPTVSTVSVPCSAWKAKLIQ